MAPQHVVDAQTTLAAGAQHIRRFDAQRRLHLGDHVIGPSDLQVDLVEYRHDGQLALHSEKGVGDRLRLHTLKRIDEQNDALASGETARHLIAEIDVAGRVDEVQFVVLVLVLVVNRDGVHLDRDAALAFEVHVVENLIAEIAGRDGARFEEELIGQRTLAVVDVGDDRKIADQLRVSHKWSCTLLSNGLGSIRCASGKAYQLARSG